MTTRNWPNQTVTVPNYSKVYALGWDRFPASLVGEINAHLDRVAGTDILAQLEGKTLKPGSVKTRRQQLCAYVSALVHAGEDPANLKTLADVVEVARVKKGLHFFLKRAENGSKAQAHDIARLLISIARHEVRVDNAQLETLQGFRKALADDKTGMSAKNKKRLRQFDDSQNLRDLVTLPADLADKVRKEVKGNHGVITQAAALRFQTALAIELLQMIPMRRDNLTRLNVDKHLDRRRNGKVYVFIEGEEVKNGVDIESELPSPTIKLLDEYMKTYQPVLAPDGSPWIFPGLPGRHKSRERLAHQVSETIKTEIGLQVHMHLFRHIAAKLYLDHNVGAYGVVQKLHGHKSIDTTIRSYCGLEAKSAVAHYDQLILELRDKAPQAPKRGRN
jgi:integrase